MRRYIQLSSYGVRLSGYHEFLFPHIWRMTFPVSFYTYGTAVIFRHCKVDFWQSVFHAACELKWKVTSYFQSRHFVKYSIRLKIYFVVYKFVYKQKCITNVFNIWSVKCGTNSENIGLVIRLRFSTNINSYSYAKVNMSLFACLQFFSPAVLILSVSRFVLTLKYFSQKTKLLLNFHAKNAKYCKN